MDKFGKTALFAACVFLIVVGGLLALRIAAPTISSLVPSLGDTLATL